MSQKVSLDLKPSRNDDSVIKFQKLRIQDDAHLNRTLKISCRYQRANLEGKKSTSKIYSDYFVAGYKFEHLFNVQIFCTKNIISMCLLCTPNRKVNDIYALRLKSIYWNLAVFLPFVANLTMSNVMNFHSLLRFNRTIYYVLSFYINLQIEPTIEFNIFIFVC